MTTRIGFLFLGPASHVAHAASIAFELQAMHGYEVTAFVSSRVQAQALKSLAERYSGSCLVQMLRADALHRLARRFKKRDYPRARYVLKNNLKLLQSFDALVLTDIPPISLRQRQRGPRMILTGHGPGPRSFGSYPDMTQFDLFLLPGKTRLELLSATGRIDEEKSRIIGYPKFDLAPPSNARKMFDNDRPIVLYNPHFNGNGSSWPQWGTRVLDYFSAHPEWNLIFAPHVLMFHRGGDKLLEKYASFTNIHIDARSQALVDMTYTNAADIYLGDVSSQAYEFVGLRPRPCIFLNPDKRDWRANAHLGMWAMGDVVTSFGELGTALREAPRQFTRYLSTQRHLAQEAFNSTDLPAGRRGAQAIVEFMSQ